MPRKLRQLINNEFYHVVLRRAGDELLFIDVDDYYRGIFSIYEFNTTEQITIRERRIARNQFKEAIKRFNMGQSPVINSPAIHAPEASEGLTIKREGERDLFVEILSFCFMPNHIHLLVRQLKEGGVSKFMQKVGAGYAAYFKSKYGIEFKGYFFQDRFYSAHIENEDQLRAVFTYIHCNPISLIEPGWKEKGIKNPQKVIKFLESDYKWSSHQDYIGEKNFPSVTNREFLLKIMGGNDGCKELIRNWVTYKKGIKEFPNLDIE